MSKYILYTVVIFIAILALWFIVDFNKNLVKGVLNPVISDRIEENYNNK
jgi:hypothetical protein